MPGEKGETMRLDFWNKREKTNADMRREDKVGRLLNSKKLIAVFIGIVILIALVSVATLVSEFGGNNAETLSMTDGEPVAAVNSSTAESMKGSFLLTVVNDSDRTVRLVALITADSESGSVDVSYIPSEQTCSVAGSEGTISDHFKNTGKDGLIYAVRACGANVDRYVMVDESNLLSLLKLFGEQTVDVKNEIRHEYKGVSYIIEKGSQTFSAENLEKYFIYLCDSRAQGSEELTGLLLRLLKLSFKNNGDDTAQKRYDEFVNLVSTDISAMDIAHYGPLLESFGEGE